MNFRVTISAQCFEIIKRKHDATVIDVLRRNRYLVVHDLRRYYQSFSEYAAMSWNCRSSVQTLWPSDLFRADYDILPFPEQHDHPVRSFICHRPFLSGVSYSFLCGSLRFGYFRSGRCDFSCGCFLLSHDLSPIKKRQVGLPVPSHKFSIYTLPYAEL